MCVFLFFNFYPVLHPDTMVQFGSLMKDLGMTASFETKFNSLSNSDQRKVTIGIALLGASDVVILEEPTKDLSLDDINKVNI